MNRDYWMAILAAGFVVWMVAGCPSNSREPAKNRDGSGSKQGKVKILHFYISPGIVPRGEPALLCYGVENAAEVRLDPPVEPVPPFYNRCFHVTPAKETVYTLVARGQDGTEVKQTARVGVGGRRQAPAAPVAGSGQGGAPVRVSFVAHPTVVQPGQPVNLCYEVPDARAVDIQPRPGGEPLKPKKGCVTVKPAQSTTYTLNASLESGGTDRMTVAVQVRGGL